MPIDFPAFVIDRVDLSSVLSVRMVGLAFPKWNLEQLRKQTGNDNKSIATPDNRGALDAFKSAWAGIDPFLDLHHQVHSCNTGGGNTEQADALIVRDGSWQNLRFTDATAY